MENQTENFESGTPQDGERVTRITRSKRYVEGFRPENMTTSVVSSRVSWGSIFAGAIIALSVQLTLSMLTIALGMHLFGPDSPGEISTISWTTGAVYIITTALSLFLGSFVAARLSNVPRQSSGLMHGLAVWSLAVLFNLVILGQVFTGISSTIGNAIGGISDIDTEISFIDTLPAGFRNDLERIDLKFEDLRTEVISLLQDTENPNLSEGSIDSEIEEVSSIGSEAIRSILLNPSSTSEELDQMVSQMINTTRSTWSSVSSEDIANIISNRSELSDAEATTMANRWKIQIDRGLNNLEENIQEARETIVQKTDQAMDTVGNFAIFGFLVLLIGAGLAMWAGWIGTPISSNIGTYNRESLH